MTDDPTQDAPSANAALVELRDALLEDASQPSVDRWLGVCERVGACKARGVGSVACDYLDAYLPAWGPPWDSPPCPCGDWSRWTKHHLPDDADARRHALFHTLPGLPQEVGCVPRVMLRGVGNAQGMAPVMLGCDAVLGVTTPSGDGSAQRLWAWSYNSDALPGTPRWRYRWDVDVREATLEAFQGASLGVIDADGVRREQARVVLRPGMVLELDDVRVEVPPEGLPRVLVAHFPRGDRWARAVVTSAQVTVGRRRESDLFLLTRVMSKQHALLFWQDGAWYVRDFRTAYGTYVNGIKVTQREVRVEPGDELGFADARMIFPAWAGGA